MARDNSKTEEVSSDLMSMIAGIHERLAAVEEDNAALRAQIEAGKQDGTINFDFGHANHVLSKHFYHDRPDVS